MAYFADLTPYAYLPPSRFTEGHNAVNIGWLDRSEPMEVGPVDLSFAAQLTEICASPVNLCRGWHTCQWCAKAHGNGEIRVTGADGTVYAAPILIAHYVSVHGYQPPKEFIQAVMTV